MLDKIKSEGWFEFNFYFQISFIIFIHLVVLLQWPTQITNLRFTISSYHKQHITPLLVIVSRNTSLQLSQRVSPRCQHLFFYHSLQLYQDHMWITKLNECLLFFYYFLRWFCRFLHFGSIYIHFPRTIIA